MAAERNSTFARPQFHTGMNDAASQDASQQPRCA